MVKSMLYITFVKEKNERRYNNKIKHSELVLKEMMAKYNII